MEWVQLINAAIEYIEKHLTEDIHCEDAARYVHISSFHFQRMFNLLTGITVGEYIRKTTTDFGRRRINKAKYKSSGGCAEVCLSVAGELCEGVYAISWSHSKPRQKKEVN